MLAMRILQRSELKLRRRFIFTTGLILLAWLTSSGCFTLLLATAVYSDGKKAIHQTHTDITIRGRIVGQDGLPLKGKYGPPNGYCIIFGERKEIHFQMESERAGESAQIISNADECNTRFYATISNVLWAKLIFIVDGYEPATFTIDVPESKDDSSAPKPIYIPDAVMVLRLQVAK